VNITWTAARDFCASLDARLPTEAEWELAARADGGGIYPWGDVFVAGAANVSGQAADREWVAAAPVASFPPMRSGLFDLIGNVWEWSADASGPFRIIKGGGFSSPAALARISLHGRMSPTAADETVGCRCVRQRRKP
jgi:formylglycine-generating enzyme required for sulfatase activity